MDWLSSYGQNTQILICSIIGVCFIAFLVWALKDLRLPTHNEIETYGKPYRERTHIPTTSPLNVASDFGAEEFISLAGYGIGAVIFIVISLFVLATVVLLAIKLINFAWS